MAKSIKSTDKRGYIPDQTKIGTHWCHFKNPDVIYEITGFEFDAEHDVWIYQYRVYDNPTGERTPFTRSPKNFHETFSDSRTRFYQVNVHGDAA